jgi:hypothetical protein
VERGKRWILAWSGDRHLALQFAQHRPTEPTVPACYLSNLNDPHRTLISRPNVSNETEGAARKQFRA